MTCDLNFLFSFKNSSTVHMSDPLSADCHCWMLGNQGLISNTTLIQYVKEGIKFYGCKGDFKDVVVEGNKVQIFFEIEVKKTGDAKVGGRLNEIGSLNRELEKVLAAKEYSRAAEIDVKIKKLEEEVQELDRNTTSKYKVMKQFKNSVWVPKAPYYAVYMGNSVAKIASSGSSDTIPVPF